MELGIVPFNGRKEFIDIDFRVELFPNLTDQRSLGAFSRLNLASWVLPVVFPLAIAPLGGENRVSPADDGGNYFDGFHWDKAAVTS